MKSDYKDKVKTLVKKNLSDLYNSRTNNFNLDLISVKVQNLKQIERQKTRNLNLLLMNEVRVDMPLYNLR
jgi:hypothetical protein